MSPLRKARAALLRPVFTAGLWLALAARHVARRLGGKGGAA